ncbi:MAG: hypothetical protein Q4Q23_03880, partial [Methanobacteriaceae archaeon]|nr:hypothetical protein [Methanobacteriaceae archaeon]
MNLLTVNNSIFKSNYAYSFNYTHPKPENKVIARGRAVFGEDNSTIDNSIFENNYVNGSPNSDSDKLLEVEGGSIYCGGNLKVNNSIFNNNSGKGANTIIQYSVYLNEKMVLNNCIFTNNTATNDVIEANGATITNCIFENNTSLENGSVLCNEYCDKEFYIKNS